MVRPRQRDCFFYRAYRAINSQPNNLVVGTSAHVEFPAVLVDGEGCSTWAFDVKEYGVANNKVCNVEGCNKVGRVRRGMCAKHYRVWRRNGKDRPKCKIEGCDFPLEGLGYCQKHYRAFKLYGDPLEQKVQRRRNHEIEDKCTIEGCVNKHRARGWCGKHYSRWRATGDPNTKRETWWQFRPGDAAKNELFADYKRNAEQRSLEFGLTKKEFISLTGMECYYCGIAPEMTMSPKSGSGDYRYNGIDRIDNNYGYVAGNCVPCCNTCNMAKRTMSIDEFISWIRRAYAHLENANRKAKRQERVTA